MTTLIKAANSYFKSNPYEINGFDSNGIPLSRFKEFDNLEETLNFHGVTLNSPKKFYEKYGYRVQIGSQQFQLQRHNVSIEEHTDDTSKGLLFAFKVISTRIKSKTRYDERAIFSYTNVDNQKVNCKLTKGDIVVFNPKKNHSLTYFGEEVTLALFDVFKLKG